MDPDPLDTEIGEEINQAEEVNANLIPPPETIIVKMRGRPAGAKYMAKAENPIIVSESAPQPHSQPDPMYTALMKRLDAMDGMLAQREAEIVKKREGTTKTEESESGKGYITPIESNGKGASFEGGI
jgi:hypothetical protein